jgi:hypothetical protein
VGTVNSATPSTSGGDADDVSKVLEGAKEAVEGGVKIKGEEGAEE